MVVLAVGLLAGFHAGIGFAEMEATAADASFVGTWKMKGSEGEVFHAVLKADGTSTSDWGPGEVGTWEVKDGKAYVTWTDGWKEIIEKTADGYKKYGFEPGKNFTDRPSNESVTEKVSE